MCNPMAIGVIGLAMSAAGTVSSISQGNKNADAAMEAANNAAQADYNATEEKQNQIAEQGSDQKLERKRLAMRERASLRTASADMGLSGVEERFSAASQLNEDLALGSIDKNVTNGIAQTQLENEKTFAINKGRINTAESNKMRGGAAGLQVASSSLKGFTGGYSLGKAIK